MFLSLPWEGNPRDVRSAAMQSHHFTNPTENKGEDLTTSRGHHCPASFLPTFKSFFFSFLGSATFSDTAAHHKRCRYTSHADIIATFAAVSFFSCSSRAFFASCRLSSCCRFSCEELSNCIIIILKKIN